MLNVATREIDRRQSWDPSALRNQPTKQKINLKISKFTLSGLWAARTLLDLRVYVSVLVEGAGGVGG